jgi:hypothetical protein
MLSERIVFHASASARFGYRRFAVARYLHAPPIEFESDR